MSSGLSKKKTKPTTKVMIHKALTDLKTRNGASLYAIKKYIEDNYKVDTKKTNHFIKKTIKAGVQEGSIIQIKGTGASGSFKLAVIKPMTEKKKKLLSSALSNKKTIKKPVQESSTSEILSSQGKKPTIKVMFHKGLEDLKIRNYAVKKYMENNYQVNTEKPNRFIKKTIKAVIEEGLIIQIKGIGASKSFKLAVDKPNTEKKEKPIEKADKKEKSIPVEKPVKFMKATEEEEEQKPQKKTVRATERNIDQRRIRVHIIVINIGSL